jgi:cytochrome c biogenesis factor
MTELKWLAINSHLIPSVICFILGFIFIVAAPSIYRIRKRKMNVLVPANIFEYSKTERILLISGVVLAVVGIISMVAISELYGYYYFKNGVPTFLKGP